MDLHPRQLPIPETAIQDERALELVRVWAAQGQQYVSLATEVWKDPAAWGILLVDLAKHVANAYEQTTGENRAIVLRRMKDGFDAEWHFETNKPTGIVVE